VTAKVSSVNQKASGIRQRCGRLRRCGRRVALYSMCRRFTISVVRTMIATGVCAAISPTAMNCDEPAKTNADIASAAANDSPEVAAMAP